MFLQLKNISKQFGEHILFNDLNLSFHHAGFYLISGKSGSGKTTLLNILAGFEMVSQGERLTKDTSFAYIFQKYELIDELNVRDNVYLYSDLFNETPKEDIFYRLGLKELENHYPSELSGGQKQRVGIARSLMQHPNIILCDEPTESLDIDNARIVLELLRELSKEIVVIVVSHQTDTLMEFVDVHYEIEDAKIVEKMNRISQTNPVAIYEKTRFNRNKLQETFNKMTAVRNKTLYLILSLLIVVSSFLYVVERVIFTEKTSLDSLNGQVVYLSLYDKLELQMSLASYDVEPIISFEPVRIKGNNYYVGIYPLVNEQYNLLANQIVINQHALKLYGYTNKEDMIGQTVDLSFVYHHITYSQPFEVIDVVEERDTYDPQIYYSKEGLEDMFGETVVSLMLEDSLYYQSVCNNNVERIYNNLIVNPEVSVYHSILNTRYQNSRFLQLYRLLFISIEGIVLFVNLFATTYFIKKNHQKHKITIAILNTMGIELKALKKQYVFVHMRTELMYMVVALGFVYGLEYVVFSQVNLYAFINLAIQLVVFLMLLVYEMIKVNELQIASILKTRFDHE